MENGVTLFDCNRFVTKQFCHSARPLGPLSCCHFLFLAASGGVVSRLLQRCADAWPFLVMILRLSMPFFRVVASEGSFSAVKEILQPRQRLVLIGVGWTC